ncbi:MAG TPA: zeta toxin family protein [Candidatus Kapabacteria bacterium]|nr:zeta toxin family protein [Candidatus Kapabacteria bacterium]
MRVFAGPNGSGKTTIIRGLQSEIPFGIYINADDIERSLYMTGSVLFDTYQLNVDENKLRDFFRHSNFSPIKKNDINLWQKIVVRENTLNISAAIDSYLAADIAEFIRQEVLENNLSFTYETVMSHKSKIDFFQKAMDNDYRVYLYFIATEDPEININRVNVRVAQRGHPVAPEVIKSRYYRSLENLKTAVMKTDRAYIFDNSGSAAVLIAEINHGTDVKIIDTTKVPSWFAKYIIEQ